MRERTPLAQKDILRSLPGPSGTLVAQQDILQSLPGPSGNRAYSSDRTSLGEDYSSDDDAQDCNWFPAGTHDEHVSSSLSSKTSTPRSIGSLTVPAVAALVSQTQDDVRKKRKRGVGMMQRKLRKERTEKIKRGEEYINQAGKKILGKSVGELKECRLKCKTKFTNAQLQRVFADYRAMETRDMQRLHLSNHILLTPPIRVKQVENKKKREVSVEYFIENEGNLVKVCQNCFLNVYGENRGFVNGIIDKKKKSATGIIGRDERGRHEPKIKHSSEAIDYVRNHISNFPAYESHYSRRHTTKKYLETGLNLQKMYNLYLDQHTMDNITTKIVSISTYSNIFKTFNLKFKKPHNDTCHTCDTFVAKIKITIDDTEKTRLHDEHVSHQDKANFHYECKSFDKQRAKASGNTIVVAVCDLQQCLATPYLNTSVAFYKRKLWTFNFTVRNCNTGKTTCFMWHEAIAQRGADEIASCLKMFIMSLAEETEHVIIYSDTCPGQTRNNTLPVVYNYILTQKVGLKTIDHKFLVPGHTHLECDADHASIERAKKKYNGRISIPNDWYMLVRMVSSKFTVIELSQDDIFAFSSILKQSLIKKNKDQNNAPFLWRNIFWIRVEKEHPCFFSFKYSLRVEDEFKICDMKRKARASRSNQPIMDVRKAYNQPLLISKEKHKDILSLLQYIDPVYHDFYNNVIKSDNDVVDTSHISDYNSDSE